MARGYTGHEMVNHLNIIQMGGRTYDAKMGRFLQADIAIQAPNNTQSFNRYSYVMNNPMTYTDPSVYFSFRSTFQAFARDSKRSFEKFYTSTMKADGRWASHKFTSKHPVLHSIGMVAIGSTGSPWGIAISAHVSSDHTFYQTGSLGKAFHAGGRTAATLGTLRAIGNNDYWNQEGSIQNIGANAVVGGVSSSAQGGKFSHGFFSAGFASAAKPMIFGEYGYSPDFKFERVVSAAVIGGTASVIAGGKFANGAVTGAFNQLYNGESYAAKKWGEIQAFTKGLYETSSFYVKEYGARALTVTGGTLQVALGASLCSTGAMCAVGGLMMAHGINNIYEGVFNTDGIVRDGYQAISMSVSGNENYGNWAYGLTDVSLSIYGAGRLVLSDSSWKLFRNIPSDYVRYFQTASSSALGLDAAVSANTTFDTINR